MKITQKELNIILDEHELWLGSDLKQRKRADFTDKDLSGLDFSGRYLYMVKFVNANCEYANFTDADCEDVDFTNANCKGANFKGAELWETIGNNKQIKSLSMGFYSVVYTKDSLQVGCQRHSFKEWLSFTDFEIDKMSPCALRWWMKFKEPLFKTIEQDPAED